MLAGLLWRHQNFKETPHWELWGPKVRLIGLISLLTVQKRKEEKRQEQSTWLGEVLCPVGGRYFPQALLRTLHLCGQHNALLIPCVLTTLWLTWSLTQHSVSGKRLDPWLPGMSWADSFGYWDGFSLSAEVGKSSVWPTVSCFWKTVGRLK